jgi:hypothetical protein
MPTRTAKKNHALLSFPPARRIVIDSTSSRGAPVSCPICEKRKGARFCPAKGEKICAICCGTEREVTIDCPVDCSYLISAHRYEDEHQRLIAADTPLRDVKVPSDLIHTHQQLMGALAFSVAKFCTAHPETTDSDVIAAILALAETHKTLTTGIYYETQPTGLASRELYVAVTTFLADLKQQVQQAGRAGPKDSEIFHLLVFLYRMGLLRTNGRPRSRRYVEFLCSQFPQSHEVERKESRIIVP